MDKLQIVKIGGNVIENRKALKEFLADFSEIKGAKIVIHGGGKEATQMAKKLGIPVQIIEGRRITDLPNLVRLSRGLFLCASTNTVWGEGFSIYDCKFLSVRIA